MQFVDSQFRSNHVLAIGFKHVTNSKSANVTDLGRTVVKDVTGFNFEDLFGLAIQDRGATKVAKALELDEEICDMHNGDKIGASAIGELTRSKNSQVINPFPTGQHLMKKLCDQGKPFETFSKH